MRHVHGDQGPARAADRRRAAVSGGAALPDRDQRKPLDHYFQWFSLTYGITVTGLPAISVPCGFTRSGLPVGLQIVGRRRQEAAVLRAAAAFEAAAPWAGRLPPVVTALATGTALPPGRRETRTSSTRRG